MHLYFKDFYVKLLKPLFKLQVFYFNGNIYYFINNEQDQDDVKIKKIFNLLKIPKIYLFHLNINVIKLYLIYYLYHKERNLKYY